MKVGGGYRFKQGPVSYRLLGKSRAREGGSAARPTMGQSNNLVVQK